MPPVLPTETIAQQCCAAGFQFDLCLLRRGTSQGASRGCRQRSVVPSLWTSVRNFTPDLRIARIAACAERQTQHCAPTGNSG